MLVRWVGILAIAVVVLLACGSPSSSDPFESGSGGTEGTSSGLSSAGGKTGETSGAPAADDDGGSEGGGATGDPYIFDVPDGPGGADGGPAGDACQKVDFLFAIDNSGSMGNKQTKLANSFPGFIAAIRENVAAQDYQIMVIDGDAVATMGSTINGCTAGSCGGLCGGCAHGDLCICTCGGGVEVCEDLGASCGDTHGAGKVQSQAGADCGIAGGKRYITDTQPGLEDTFGCVALVGDYGMALERPVTGAIKAITLESDPGGCNEGFLRSDALLVVTFITDDPPGGGSLSMYEDAGYLADAPGWFDAVVGAKGGEPNNVVMLGVVDSSSGAQVFVDFVHLFGDRGLLGDVNAANYTAFFEEAVAKIDTACDEFEPAG